MRKWKNGKWVCPESLDFEMGMIFLVFVSLEFLFVLVFNWFLGSGLFCFGCFCFGGSVIVRFGA